MWRAAQQHPGQAVGRRNNKVPKILIVAIVGGAFALAATWSWGDRWGLQADGEDVAFVCDLKGDRARLERGSLTCRRLLSISMTPNVEKRKMYHHSNKPAEPAKILPYGSTEREEWNPMTHWQGEKSYHPSLELQDDKYRQWYHFDADGKHLSDLATNIYYTLYGKRSPLFENRYDVGAFVVVTNCERVRVVGKKYHYKIYIRNLSNLPTGFKVERFCDLIKRFPERIIMKAVWGMMPKTKKSRRIFKERLKLFAGPNHVYYHKDPVAFPMHKIKDVRFEDGMRHRDKYEVYHKQVKPREQKIKEWKQQKRDRKLLSMYKNFLRHQFHQEGPEAVERDDLDELAARAEDWRLNSVLTATEGKPIIKRERKIFWKTYIPVKKVQNQFGQRRPP